MVRLCRDISQLCLACKHINHTTGGWHGLSTRATTSGTSMEVDIEIPSASDSSMVKLSNGLHIKKEKRKFNAKLYGRTIQKGFSKLHKDESLADLTLIVGDEKIPVHRMVSNKIPLHRFVNLPRFVNPLWLGVVRLVGDISSNAWKRISLGRSLTEGTRGQSWRPRTWTLQANLGIHVYWLNRLHWLKVQRTSSLQLKSIYRPLKERCPFDRIE